MHPLKSSAQLRHTHTHTRCARAPAQQTGLHAPHVYTTHTLHSHAVRVRSTFDTHAKAVHCSVQLHTPYTIHTIVAHTIARIEFCWHTAATLKRRLATLARPVAEVDNGTTHSFNCSTGSTRCVVTYFTARSPRFIDVRAKTVMFGRYVGFVRLCACYRAALPPRIETTSFIECV